MVSKPIKTLRVSYLDEDESVEVVTKNTFLCFQHPAESQNQYSRSRSSTCPALPTDFTGCTFRDWECETIEGSGAESDSSTDGWNSEQESRCESRVSNSSQTSGDLRRAMKSGTLLEEHATTKPLCHEKRSLVIQPRDYTTIMLRNLPNDYSRDMLINLLESKGFGRRFDFVYLPVDFVKHSGLGYAFVNFVSNGDARIAMNLLDGFDDWEVRSQKVLQLSWSKPLQGLAANIERYRNSAVMHVDVPQHLKPLVFENGCPVAFPAPTRCIALGVGSKLAVSLGSEAMQSPTPMRENLPKTQPRKKHPRNLACPKVNPEDYTTIMLRNLPNNYTRGMLVELLELKGFRRRFDFVYVPSDFERGSGLGYGFVNFVRHDDAQDAMRILQNFDDWKVPSRKVLQLSWSIPLQGLNANIERYRNTSVMHPDVPEDFKPMVFKDGHPACFPPPSRIIHPPQRRN